MMYRVENYMKTSSCNYPELIDILDRKIPCMLATVIHTQGSTPQKAGSSALIGINQLLAGTVGGGMTELKVIQQSQNAFDSKKSGIFSFNLGGELTKGSDSICGGNMTVLLDAAPELHLPVFMQLRNSLGGRKAGVLMTLVDESDPENIKINRYWLSKTDRLQLPDDLRNMIEPVISEMLQNPMVDPCRMIPVKGKKICINGFAFLESIIAKPALVIAGAGHIGKSLAHLGKFLGFEVIVWDDRPEYADQTKISDADIVLSGTVDSSLGQIKIQEDSYLVIVTHGHKSDAEVLRKFISKPAAYVGMIGSKAKVSQLRMSFLENGWATPEQWEQIFTPIGLDIGALTVEEIALSIVAQLVKVRNQRKDTSE
jgi:xanthine dehydrogenase accessory factor